MSGVARVAAAVAVATAAAVLTAPPVQAAAAVPAFDHTVVVILENHSAAQVLGNPAAPYINSVAASGATMTRSYAVTHPSQPNYIALFAGSTLGVTTNDCPLSLSGPNLATTLAAAGKSFATYSEDLPSVGYTGCVSGAYARKHNPVVNFASVPASANQPLTAFPSDYSTLPSVSFLVPNLQHDMHDGTIAMADSWLQSTIEGYRQWAASHNSLLVLTFDEDDNNSANQIPTVLSGANVVAGSYADQITHYNLLRTLTDAHGAAPVGLAADVPPILSIWGDPGNRQPTVSFTSSVTGLTASLDGSASTDPDGPIASYAWDFGDGTTGTGLTASHTYALPGTYSVSLTVTDAGGAVGSRTQGVAVGNGIASDTFGRTVTGGWGVADVGGPWLVAGSTSNYGVSGGAGSIRVNAGSAPSAILRDVSSSDTDLAVSFTTDKPTTGSSGQFVWLVGRRVAGVGDYRAKIRLHPSGSTTILVQRVTSASAETPLTTELPLAGVTFAPGSMLRARLQVTGTSPTTVRARLWKVGSAEPTTWQASATDATAGFQARGQAGVMSYLSSNATNAPITLLVDDLVATSSAPPPPVNSPPSPAFTWSATDLSAVLDATGSTDAEGPIASFAWTFGDGTTGTGATTTHAYAAAGTYPVTLAVTDSGGLVRSTVHQVVVTAPPPPNTPPTAAFTSGLVGRDLTVDGSGSSDAEGPVASWSWDFGDGAQATGATATHTYAQDGTYTVALQVTDAGGLTATTSRSVVVATGPADAPPTAAFTATPTDLRVDVDGSTSSDAEGAIASYAWSFGDGSTGTGATATRTYAAGGTYTITLVVTDSAGQTASTSRTVTVTGPPPPNTPPTASFTATTTDLRVDVDGRASSDAEGAISSYAWDFGDGATATGATAAHTYAAAGQYDVVLTVTDAGGLTGSTTRRVTATAPNTAPQAAFTATATGLVASVDGRASSDAEGAIASYAWSFGDGTTGAGATATRTYAAAGTYTITLTVTDAGGLTGSTTRSVTVTAPPPTVRAADEFGRTVTGGWGSADVGGAWTTSGAATAFAVAGGQGTVKVAPGSGPTAFLRSVSSSDTDVALTLTADQLAAGSGLHLSLTGRRVTGAGDLRVKVRILSTGATSLLLQRLSSTGVETAISSEVAVPAAAFAPGTRLRVRLLVTGTSPTTVRAKVWKVGSAEPGWLVSATDATAGLQAPGQLGVTAYISSAATAPVSVSVDSLDARASTP